MTVTPARIAWIFAANPVRRVLGGDGWHVDSAVRDIARVHHLTTEDFAFSLEGATEFDSPGFCAQIIMLRSGELSVDQAGQSRTLSAGDIFVACAWQPMSLEGTGSLDALIIAVPAWWAMQHFLDGLAVLPGFYVPGGYFAAPTIANLGQTLFALPDGDEASASQALIMIADLMRTALGACTEAGKAKTRWQGRMGAILEFIIHNLETPGLSAQDAAVSLRCSVRTIYKTCAAYGTSFNAYLNEIRLVTAQYRLMRTNDRISHIAYAVGFSSLSHFSHLFRERFGVSARTMRQDGCARLTQRDTQ